MARILAFGCPASRRNSADVSLMPELRPDGTITSNSPRVERYRLFLQRTRKPSTLGEIAARLGRADGRIYRESEGKAPLSVDLLIEDALRLPVDKRARIVTDLCRELGLEAPLFRVGGLDE